MEELPDDASEFESFTTHLILVGSSPLGFVAVDVMRTATAIGGDRQEDA